jgi:predicted ribonuclease YlaK
MFGLRPKQKHAGQAILDSHDLVVNLRGAAGTGKTATLQELQRGLVEGGPAGRGGGSDARGGERAGQGGLLAPLTIERLLQENRNRSLIGKVLIVDEAAIVSSRQMAELL